MHTASLIFAMIAAGTGFAAAFYWYRSSGFEIGPLGPKWGLPGTGMPIEPVDPEQKALDMAVANWSDLQDAINEINRVGRLNKIAAHLTASSVAASAIATILASV
jgi:hypothetical protein